MTDGQVVESNPAEAEAAINGQADSSNGTLNGQNGQAATQAQSAPAEERFTEIDPETLPPELKAKYKSMQMDYTKKTQEIASLRKKADSFDQISQDQRFVDYWKGLNKQQKSEYQEQKAEVEKRLGEKISDEDFQKAFTDKDAYLSLHERMIKDVLGNSQKEIAELKQKLTEKDAQDVVESFATELGKDGKPVRPDFYALDEDRLISGFLHVNPPENTTGEAYRQRLNEAYDWAKSLSQKFYEKGKTDALARIQQKAATSTNPPTGSSKGVYTGPKIPSVKEAIEMAKKGERVVRDD